MPAPVTDTYIGEIRKISHIVESDTQFAVSSVTITVYDSTGAVIVNAASGGTDSSNLATSHEIFYLLNTNTANAGNPMVSGDYTYLIKYVIGTETLGLEGNFFVENPASRYSRWIRRVISWLVDTDMGEAQRQLSKRDLRDAINSAISEYQNDNPQRKQLQVTMSANTWEYALPTDWQDNFSVIEAIEYPFDTTKQIRPFLRPSWWYVDELRDKWMFVNLSPSANLIANLTYTAPHVLNDSTDTINPQHFDVVSQYAAGVALQSLANKSAGYTASNIGADIVGYRTKQMEYKQQAECMKKEAKETWGQTEPETQYTSWDYLSYHGFVYGWVYR